VSGKHADHVVQNENLAVAVATCADADGGHRCQACRDLGWQPSRRDHLEHHQCGTGLFQSKCVRLELGSPALAATLHAIAAELMHGLGRQTDMSTDRYATFDQKANGVGDMDAAFELDHLSARCHQTSGVPHGLFRTFLVAAERHVGDQEGSGAAARDTFGVVDHVLHGHGQG
jgi:hypothetical protein